MEANAFVASVRHSGDVAIVDLAGQLDGTAEKTLQAAWNAVGDASVVVLNFSKATYINSTGIALIVGLLGRARETDKTVRAFGLMDHYKEIFDITRLSDFIDIHADETGAVEGLAAKA
ncbi:MAG: STAS domain-containing protein, partial [Actinomycetota bacterium]